MQKGQILGLLVLLSVAESEGVVSPNGRLEVETADGP